MIAPYFDRTVAGLRRMAVCAGALAVVAWCSGCAHTNNFAHYPFSDSTVVYHTSMDGQATVHSSIPSYDTTWVAHLITGIAEGASNALLENKLSHVDPAYLAGAVTRQISHDLRDRLRCREGSPRSNDHAYTVESTIHDCTLRTSAQDAHLSLSVRVRVVRSLDQALVWEDGDQETVLLTGTGGPLHRGIVTSVVGAINAAAIIAMSDEELRELLIAAAEQAAATLSQEIVDDVLKAGR